MEPLPPTWQQLFDELEAQRAKQAAQLEEQGRQLAKQTEQLGSLISQLDTLSKMLRRREEQIARLGRENRRLRRRLGLDEPDLDPEPDPSSPSPPPSDPPAGASSSKSPGGKSPSKKRKPRRRGGRRPPPSHLPEDLEHHEVCACGERASTPWALAQSTRESPLLATAPRQVRASASLAIFLPAIRHLRGRRLPKPGQQKVAARLG